MTKGMPDWKQPWSFGYGGTNAVYGDTVVAASAETSLLSITGKGVVLGGLIVLEDTVGQKDDRIRVEVDGEILAFAGPSLLMSWNVISDIPHFIYLIEYDLASPRMVVALSRDFAFETSMEIIYEENQGNTPSVHHHVDYSIII